jgi:hypothetical protein
MAFKMNPGRGSFAKTGRSIPTPFKQVDKEVDLMIAKKKARTENDMKAKADSTGVDKRLRDAGMPYMAGKMGNKKANETRATLKGQYTYSMDKDEATGKYKKNFSKSPAKQVDKEVDEIIKKKKERDAKAKNDKARKEGEEGRAADDRKIRIKLSEANEYKAKSDSTAVDKRLRDAGMPYNAGVMGNKKANETRKEGSPYKGVYKSVDLDASTGKYKKTTKLSPAKQYIDANFDKDKKQREKNAASHGPLGKSMDKGASKSSMSDMAGNKRANETRQKVSPAKQLGRQAVTKMGGKKAPAKMKSC